MSLEPFVRCSRCNVSRPASQLHNGVCADGFCTRVVNDALEVAQRHVTWWCSRFPKSQSYRDDIFQEAATAAWLARATYQKERGPFAAYAFPRMRTAVRTFLERGVGVVARKATGPTTVFDEEALLRQPAEGSADHQCLLHEASEELQASYRLKGFSSRDAELLARLELGETLADAGQAAGVSRQRAHQIRSRAARANSRVTPEES